LTEPDVRVRSVRRRRSEVTLPPPSTTPHVRNWLIYGGLTTMVVALMLDGSLSHRPRTRVLPHLSQATEVRSDVTQLGDSLRVVVSWDLTLADSPDWPDSIRVTVVTEEPRESLSIMRSARQLADTVTLAAPPPGDTIAGLCCVAAKHPEEMQEDACIPWQYARPAAVSTAEPGKGFEPAVPIARSSSRNGSGERFPGESSIFLRR
jgi:hypothetical protein